MIGMPQVTSDRRVCSSCLLGKQTRKSFPQATTYRASKALELIHSDLCGPITPSTRSGNKYVFVLIDDHTRYMWTILLKEKSEVFEKFKRFKTMVEAETKLKVQTFRTDRGGEFTSREFNEFCDREGVKRHLTAPYSPQQNGVVERRNGTLMEMTRSVLKHFRLPNYMWGEAMRHSAYILNRVATRVLKHVTPYEALRGSKPNLSHIRTFGCIGYAKVVKPHLKKLEDRSRVLINLGTEPGSKSYRMYDPQTKTIVVSRDVIFDESKGWNWKTEDKEQSTTGEFSIELGSYGNHGISEETIGGTSSEISGPKLENDETEAVVTEDEGEDNTEPILRRSQRQTKTPSYLDDYVLLLSEAEEEGEILLAVVNSEPRNFDEARGSKEWTSACVDELRSIEKNGTWTLVDLPNGVKPIGLKWIFKLKRNSDGSINKFKARLVAKGYVQRHGIDFDEVYAPVARIETIRLLINIAAAHDWEIHHLDVKTAFLHGDLKETVFVTQPEGFEVKGSENKVYKLHKA